MRSPCHDSRDIVSWYHLSRNQELSTSDLLTGHGPGRGRAHTDVCAGGEAIATTGRESLCENVGQEPDAELVTRAQGGDTTAFGDLVRRHERAVYAVVSRMIDSRDDVDDLVQDVFVTAFRSLAKFQGKAAFSTWLYRIAVNTTIKQMRKARVRKTSSIDDPAAGLAERLMAAGSDGPEAVTEQTMRGEAVRKAIGTLPDKHKAVVVLHYYENLSCEEIARVAGCSVGTVWSRLHYACKKLHGQLEWLASESCG
jgi:RNA polymerase sigma-70 factor, ECF subfamily